MLHTVDEREFQRLILDKEDILSARNGYASPLIIAITIHWMAALEQPAISILVYLIGRTVAVGKGAERITVREFVEGSHDVNSLSAAFSGLPMSVNTLRKHIKALCDSDLINVYSVRAMLTASENQARMFEINFSKVLDVPVMAIGKDEFIAQIEAKIAAEKEAAPYQNLLGAPS